MAKILYRLYNAPDDEVLAITALLTENDIQFYATEAGRWFVGVAALWVADESQYNAARALINEYLEQRYLELESQHARIFKLSFIQGLKSKLRENPIGFLVNITAIVAVLFVSFTLALPPFL